MFEKQIGIKKLYWRKLRIVKKIHSTERATLSVLIQQLDTQPPELLNDLIPAPKSGGRPREVDMWEILNAIFYIPCRDAVGGLCQETFAGQTVYTYFRNWRVETGRGYMIVYGSG